MDDRKYPFLNIPGIIRIAAKKNDSDTIRANLSNLLDFLSYFSLPKLFMIDTKFEVSSEVCTIRGRSALTGEIKTVKVRKGDFSAEVEKEFGWQ